jgi:putative endonuclease
MVTLDRRRVGRRGEDLAAGWYTRRGYEVVARNWRCREGELDLVCRRGTTVAVCEVKARASDAFGPPQAAVTAAKRRRIRRVAARWLRATGTRCCEVRFDVAAVRGEVVEVLEGAW